MEKLIAYSDLHFHSPGRHAWPHGIDALEFGENVIHASDCFEFKNIPYKKVIHYKEEFRVFLNKCKLTNTVYVASNHGVSVERDMVGEYFIVKEFNGIRILVTHGHRLYWKEKKYTKWENKKPGKGWWKLQWISMKNGSFNESSPKRPPQYVIDECLRLCKLNDCKAIIFGHTHHTADFMEQGIRIINVGRGRTELWF